MMFSLFVMLVPFMVDGGIPHIANATVKDVAWVYLGNSTGGPIDFPQWFIRDLIVVTFLSPFVYVTVMIYRIGIMAILMLAWLCFWAIPWSFLGNSIGTCLFFH